MMYVYILKCSDESFYVGVTNDMERRLKEHQTGKSKHSYTSKRLPVELVWHEKYTDPKLAISVEKQIKGWSRKKKQALISGDFNLLVELAKRRTKSND